MQVLPAHAAPDVPSAPGRGTPLAFASPFLFFLICPPQHWNGVSFDKKSLKELGLRIQLGHWHARNRQCALPEPAAGDTFVIVDEHGVHEVALDFCGCGVGGATPLQLLRARLYPATTLLPRTAATFNVLDRFQLLAFESKCSAYEFYHSLARESDNTGVNAPPVCRVFCFEQRI